MDEAGGHIPGFVEVARALRAFIVSRQALADKADRLAELVDTCTTIWPCESLVLRIDQRFTELRIVASARWPGHALRLQPEKSPRKAWAADWLVRSRGPVASVILSLLYLAIVAPLAALAVRPL